MIISGIVKSKYEDSNLRLEAKALDLAPMFRHLVKELVISPLHSFVAS